MKMTKWNGTPFQKWLSNIDEDIQKKIRFMQLREFYEDGLTPEEVKIKVDIDG